jgi:P pilus assembly chaperone PapD
MCGTQAADTDRKLRNTYKLTARILFISVIVTLIQLSDLAGQGNLLISPRRIVFDGGKRTIDMNLANTGQDSATYAISLVQIRMKEDGNFENITEPDPGQQFADRYIRFFPRSVKLAANESQVVKVQLVRAGELKEGEYRSHFYFRAVPMEKPLGEEEKADTTTLSIKLTPIFGITIPVIVRSGASNTKVSITELTLNSSPERGYYLSARLTRSGNMSVYGDLKAEYINQSGVVTRVALANGMAIYTPNTARIISLSLNQVLNINYNTGKLRLTYSAPSDVKPEKYAEAEITLN